MHVYIIYNYIFGYIYSYLISSTDISVINSASVFCYDTCNPGTPGSNTGTGIQTGLEDSSIGNNNECCSGSNNLEGFTTGAFLTAECDLCK